MEIFVMRQLVNVLYVNLDSTDTSAEVNKNLKEIKSQKKSPWLWCHTGHTADYYAHDCKIKPGGLIWEYITQ